MTNDLEIRLEASEMWLIRIRIRISWTEKKSNQEVMEMERYKRFLFKTIRKRQLQFFGAYKQSGWNRKANIEWKDFGNQKQRETMHKIHRKSE